MSLTPQKNPKLIVYINEFARYDSQGKLLCRNRSCENYPKFPYRKYCSKKCNRDFRRWYYHNFYWERVRSDIFKRDNYICQICKRQFRCRYRRGGFARSARLECDHIIPRSLFKELGYKFDTFENKVSATLDFLHNHNNLRTLCHSCHREVTCTYLAGYRTSIKNADIRIGHTKCKLNK
jgi:5-methylcytosine-specific restriction endonuclease McrA